MSAAEQPRAAVSQYFIGWDVGGWNCDQNPNSRDALVILDGAMQVVGKPYRGNLREAINQAQTSADWVRTLFEKCKAGAPAGVVAITLAIDTPLGFADGFRRLATRLKPVERLGVSAANPYLFRRAERWLFENGLSPLSAVKDMIGSQATKGMHVLAKFAPRRASCGVWTDGAGLTAIEAYPSVCKTSATITDLRKAFPPLGHDDKDDALVCALVAYLFTTRRAELAPPEPRVSRREGWIWVPKDALRGCETPA